MELINVPTEYVVGVRIGSMLSVERNSSGVDEDTRVGMHACSKVAGSNLGATENEGSKERQGYMERGWEEIGVTRRRVRMRSRGARMVAAMAVAATATASEVSGEGESIISRPPMPPVEPTRPGSGTLRMAQIALRNQLSVVLSRKL
jgi:hypothetical protein